GLGQHIEVTSAINEDFLLFLSVERINNPARGRMGGLPGAAGRIDIAGSDETLPGKGEVRVKAGETLVFKTPGGGGFGDPADRAAEDLARDLKTGIVSQ
ncbi:MAG: hydantoinase B/oxoprolinase family protein, partial [Thiolinea sp.]